MTSARSCASSARSPADPRNLRDSPHGTRVHRASPGASATAWRRRSGASRALRHARGSTRCDPRRRARHSARACGPSPAVRGARSAGGGIGDLRGRVHPRVSSAEVQISSRKHAPNRIEIDAEEGARSAAGSVDVSGADPPRGSPTTSRASRSGCRSGRRRSRERSSRPIVGSVRGRPARRASDAR